MHAEQPERPHLLGELGVGNGPLLPPFPDLGEDAIGHVAAYGVADQPFLVGEELIDAQEVGRVRPG
jgi:hypothetical protein